MALTPSNMLEIGTTAENFELPDPVSGKSISLESLKSEKATVIAFICNHCPFVKHLEKEFAAFAKEYQERGVSVVAISSNNVETHPEDSPEKMKALAIELEYTFPYLYDETQEVARAYKAACTPDFYIFDSEMKLAYRGQFDSSRPGNDEPVTGSDMRHALNRLLINQSVSSEQIPSMGCNIKWK